MLRFTGQKGRHATGFYRHPEGWESSFTATLEGTEIFRILLDDGTIELTGTIEVNAYGRLYFLLTIRGGSADGATLAFGDSG